jgi:hypothetical protein
MQEIYTAESADQAQSERRVILIEKRFFLSARI